MNREHKGSSHLWHTGVLQYGSLEGYVIPMKCFFCVCFMLPVCNVGKGWQNKGSTECLAE